MRTPTPQSSPASQCWLNSFRVEPKDQDVERLLRPRDGVENRRKAVIGLNDQIRASTVEQHVCHAQALA